MAFKRILVAIDDGDPADWAIEAASSLAHKLHARLAFVNVIFPRLTKYVESGRAADIRERAQSLVNRARDRARGGIREVIVREGAPGEEIAAAAQEWNADLIVIGRHNRGSISRFFLGSTAQAVVRHAPCPVLVMGHPFSKSAKEYEDNVEVTRTARAPRVL